MDFSQPDVVGDDSVAGVGYEVSIYVYLCVVSVYVVGDDSVAGVGYEVRI
jgi:hypothetical protein